MVSRAAAAAYVNNVRRRRWRDANDIPPPVIINGILGDAAPAGGLGGWSDGSLVAAFGTMSPTTAYGVTFKLVASSSGSGRTIIYLDGDQTAFANSKTLYVNGVAMVLFSAAFGSGNTVIQYNGTPLDTPGAAFTLEYR